MDCALAGHPDLRHGNNLLPLHQQGNGKSRYGLFHIAEDGRRCRSYLHSWMLNQPPAFGKQFGIWRPSVVYRLDGIGHCSGCLPSNSLCIPATSPSTIALCRFEAAVYFPEHLTKHHLLCVDERNRCVFRLLLQSDLYDIHRPSVNPTVEIQGRLRQGLGQTDAEIQLSHHDLRYCRHIKPGCR